MVGDTLTDTGFGNGSGLPELDPPPHPLKTPTARMAIPNTTRAARSADTRVKAVLISPLRCENCKRLPRAGSSVPSIGNYDVQTMTTSWPTGPLTHANRVSCSKNSKIQTNMPVPVHLVLRTRLAKSWTSPFSGRTKFPEALGASSATTNHDCAMVWGFPAT